MAATLDGGEKHTDENFDGYWRDTPTIASLAL
jgi:hypothetical protein